MKCVLVLTCLFPSHCKVSHSSAFLRYWRNPSIAIIKASVNVHQCWIVRAEPEGWHNSQYGITKSITKSLSCFFRSITIGQPTAHTLPHVLSFSLTEQELVHPFSWYIAHSKEKHWSFKCHKIFNLTYTMQFSMHLPTLHSVNYLHLPPTLILIRHMARRLLWPATDTLYTLDLPKRTGIFSLWSHTMVREKAPPSSSVGSSAKLPQVILFPFNTATLTQGKQAEGRLE